MALAFFFLNIYIKKNVLLSSYFRHLMTSLTLRFIFEHPLKQWLTGRRKEKDKNTKIWIS